MLRLVALAGSANPAKPIGWRQVSLGTQAKR